MKTKNKTAFMKFTALFLCLTLAFGMVACGDKDKDPADPAEPEGQTDPGTASEVVDVKVEQGLTEVTDADWGVCLTGGTVMYDLGMELTDDWTMKGTLDKLDENALESQSDVLQGRLEAGIAEAGMGDFTVSAVYNAPENIPEAAETEDVKWGELLDCVGVKLGDQANTVLETGAGLLLTEQKYRYFTKMDTQDYFAASEVNIPELCELIKSAYGISIDPEKFEKALKETFDRAAYYIVPESDEPYVAEETEPAEIGEGGPYHCMLGQSATVTGTDYTEKVDLVIQAYQVQIGEAGMYIHVERAREYND